MARGDRTGDSGGLRHGSDYAQAGPAAGELLVCPFGSLPDSISGADALSGHPPDRPRAE